MGASRTHSDGQDEALRKRLDIASTPKLLNIGALIVRIGFWGPLYYNDNKEPPTCIGPYILYTGISTQIPTTETKGPKNILSPKARES